VSINLNEKMSVSWPVLVVLIGLGMGGGALTWRVDRLERDQERTAADMRAMDARAAEDRKQIAVMANSLGKIEAGVTDIQQQLRAAKPAVARRATP
jgi:uncharacterized protein (DUF1786 family)